MEKSTGPWNEFQSSSPSAESGPWDEFKAPAPKPRTRGLFEAVNDNVIEFANAAAGGVSALANFVKPGNAVSGFIDENIIKAGEQKQSDVVQGAKRQLSQGLDSAQGVGEEVGAVGRYVLDNPLLAASQAAGSFALPAGTVKGAGMAAKALGAGVKGVESAGRVGGIAAGAAMAGGDAAGTAYDLSSQAGATEEQALAAGRQASVIPALVGGVTGAFGAERLLAGAKGFGGNALSRGLKSGLSEAGQEAVEEGVTQFEGQRAAMPYDATIDPTKGVAGAAAMGGMMGFGPGAVLGAMGEGSKPSQQMGIDPGAGPLSRAAAASVDSQPVPQPLGASITGTAPADLMGRATDPLAAQIAEDRQQAEAGSVAQESPAAASEPVPLEQRSLDELRQAFRSAQDPAIRKTIAAEIRKRREAMPDPLAPVQQQQEIALEPQATEAVQSQPKEAQAEPAEPVALGQPLTDAGTNLLGRGADPLQSIIQGQADERRAADVFRGTRNSSSGTGADIADPGVANDVGSPDGATGAAESVIPQQGQPGAGERPAADQASLRPDGWRTTAIKAGKVARSLGLDPKGKRLKEIVAEIDAVDAGSGVAAKPAASGYEAAKSVRDAADARVKKASEAMQKYPRGAMGLTPDDVKASPQWKADKAEMDAAMRDLQKANSVIAKDFAKEYRAERDAKRAAQANVKNTPSSAAGTEAKASPVEARAPEGGNAAADTGVPAAPGAGDVQADGVKPSSAKAKKPVVMGPAMRAALESVGIDPDAPVDKAAKLRRDANKLAAEARKMLDGIVPGQPVMSTRDRNLRERSGDKMRKAGEMLAEADRLDAEKAAQSQPKTETSPEPSKDAGSVSQAKTEAQAQPVNPEPSKAAQPKAEKPAEDAPAPKKTVEKPASKTPTIDRSMAVMDAVRAGTGSLEDYKASFAALESSEEAVKAELNAKTKDELLKSGGPYFYMRFKNETKPEIIRVFYKDLLNEYALGKSYGSNSWVMSSGGFAAHEKRQHEALKALVEAQTDEDLKAFAAEVAARREEGKAKREAKKAAIANPQTLEDFRAVMREHITDGKTRKEAFLMLTPEQRVKYDELEAETTKEARETRKRERKTEVRAADQSTGGQIIATKHTRSGYDLFVVQLSDRLSREDYNTVLASAKKLGGWYSSFRGNGAVPGFQFKEKSNAEAFLKLAGGDTTDAKAQAEQRRDTFEDDRSQTAVERLRTMADKLEDQARDIEVADRKTNTARRARFASRALAGAAEMKAKAKTMRNVAQSIEDGKAKFLDGIRTKTQVDMLSGMVATAKNNELRVKYESYAEQEKRKGEPPTAETADFAEFPAFTAYRSDLASLARQMLEVEGTKKLGQQLMKIADDVSDAYIEFSKQPGNLARLSTFSIRRGDEVKTAIFPSKDLAERAIKRSGLTGKAIVLAEKRGVNRIIMSPSEAINAGIWTGDGDKRITLTADAGNTLVEAIGRRGNKRNGLAVPWQFQTAHDRLKALARMGIETPAEFRSALREFIGVQERATSNKVREMELAMVGKKNDGLDFFPTPAEVADQMVEASDLTPEMDVLEPSGGMGHIADRIRETGAEPDVVEMAEDRRELLTEKGYELVGRDFLDLSGKLYDRIIMNPPFSNRRDAEHVRHAYSLLKPGGRIVAIMGEGVFFGSDKKAQDFRDWLDSVGGTDEKLPAGSFMDPSLPVNTGVNARMVVIDKPAGDAATQGDGDQDIQLDASSAGVATGTSYATATGAQQKAATAFAERLSKGRDSFVLMDAVNPSGARQQEAQTVANLAKTMFGREVVFVKFKGRPLFNGAVSTTDPGKIFVNIESARPMMAVLGHELLHELRKSNPAAYNQLAKTLKTVTKDDYIYEALLKKKYRDQGLNWTPQDISEELYGDIVGDNFMDPKFWEAIAGDKPILAKQLYRAVMNWLNKIAAMFKRMKARQDGSMVLTLAEQADGSRPFGTQKYLQDIEAARAAVAQAMGRFGKTTPQGQTDALSIADAVEQIKQFDVKSAPKSAWAHYRGMALQALGRRQLVDLYAEELPQLETYNDLVQQMDAEKNDTGAEADRVAQDWGSLKGGMDRKLAELMHDATLAKMDPDKPMPAGYFKRDYDALKARFDALSPEAKTLYRKARDMYVDHYKAVQQAIKDRVERSEMSEGQKRKMMADLDDKLFKELKGVYFPLARFGQYVIVVKDANGEVVNVTRAETVKEAEQARKELQKAFPASSGNTVGKVLKQAEFNAGRDAVGKGFMADLMGALDEKGVDDELRDTVAQLYLSSLPDLSWAKHGIHRKGTPGFSQDARRAFAQNMFHGARYLAKLRHADRLQDLLIEMQDHIKAYEGVEEYDSVQAQQVVDEMVKRHEWLMNPKASPVSTALTSFGFLFHMGLSPASAMVNLTQTALVAYPQMGAKWGFARAGAALTKASEETVRAKNDLSQVLKGDELDAFNRAVKDGTIDVTMAHDLAGIAQGEDQGVMWKIRPVMRWASFMFHHAEKFNRQATFLAAYRLAKAANPAATQSQLYEQAKQATYDGHFDYSSSNRARIMQGNWQRVIFLFKQYAQSMVYTMARNAYLSVKALDPKERSQARKTLGGILAAHAAAAGVLGLPIVGPLLTVASWIGGDDDEPWDAEVAMQNAMAEMIGPKAAEVMARGFSRLTPFDLSGRVALNKLILPDVQEGLEGKEWAESAMAAALGPVAGIGVNMARGAQKITEGDYMRGLEDMMPTALRGPLKAMRYASEGAVDKTGVTITEDVSAAGVLGQASGFSPSQVRRDTERRSAIYSYDRALLERRSVLMRMFAQAQMSGDLETAQEVRQDIQRFNEKNPTRRITPMNLAASIRNRRKRIEEAEQGVYLPSKRRDALEAVTF